MTFFTLLGKEFKTLKKNIGVIVILFLVPVFIIFIMGYAFADDETKYSIGIINNDTDSKLAQNIVDNFDSVDALNVQKFNTVNEAESAVEKAEIQGYIDIPKDFDEKEESGQVKINFTVDNTYPVKASAFKSIVEGYIEKYNEKTTAVHTAVNVGMTINPNAKPDDLVSLASNYLNSRDNNVIDVVTEYTSADEHNVMSSFNQTTCGMTAMFILFLCILWGSGNFLEERLDGTINRLLVSPVGFGTIFSAKLVYISFLAFMQFVIFFSIGHFFLNVPIGNLSLLILLNLVFIASASSIGLLISLTAKTRIMSIGLSFLIIMIFSPLGGLWFPLSTVPEILVNIAGILPSGAYMLAIEKIIIKQQSFYDIIPNISVIMIFFIIALTSSMVIGIKRKKTLWI